MNRYPLLILLSVCFGWAEGPVWAARDGDSATPAASVQTLLSNFCIDCHQADDPESGLDLQTIADRPIVDHLSTWEKVVRKINARQMPPGDAPRPDEATYDDIVQLLETRLDRIAAETPRPGRTETFRRLTRFEYQNAVRDLLAVEIDATTLLPADEVSHGFDNITVGELSPSLLNRYISAAQKIAKLAVGGTERSPGGMTIRLPADRTQEQRAEGLPIGTRGGVLFPYTFPQDGEYEIQVRLTRDRNEHVEGLREPHEMEVLVDLNRVALLTVRPPNKKSNSGGNWDKASHENVDRHLKVRIPVTAGRHEVSVTFLKKSASLLETRRQPLNVHFNMYRHPRLTPAVYQVSIAGPFDPKGPGDTDSRNRVFVHSPKHPDEDLDSARTILSSLMRRAYRRPVTKQDLEKPLEIFQQGRADSGFETGIETALSAVLVNPSFLFRIERDPDGLPPDTAYRINDFELASRLSFFLWSSLPDDELLDLADKGTLSDASVLEQQTRRMLADRRSQALVSNFAGQWLHLRNLDSITPDQRLFPDFDDNLRQAFRQETELFFESIVREDRSVLDLLQSDDTFLNERLAKHYGIPHVYGTRFRRVALEDGSRRGGILRHGSILTVTSYATRTSPVLRGKWILENLLGTPPPPPPDNVPPLEDNTVVANLSVRERLAQHRAHAACASCHDLIDPVGLSLENYDAVGRWREYDGGQPVDASGGLPDGKAFTGVEGLEEGLLARPESFVQTLSEKLMTYGLGRGLEPTDAPAIRQVVRKAKADGYRFSDLVIGIVQSVPFQMRATP